MESFISFSYLMSCDNWSRFKYKLLTLSLSSNGILCLLCLQLMITMSNGMQWIELSNKYTLIHILCNRWIQWELEYPSYLAQELLQLMHMHPWKHFLRTLVYLLQRTSYRKKGQDRITSKCLLFFLFILQQKYYTLITLLLDTFKKTLL